MADLETLTLQITAESNKALSAIDNLSRRLNNLSLVVNGLEIGKLNQLSFGLSNLTAVIEHMKGATRASDFTRIVKELGMFSNVDTNRLYALSTSLTDLSRAFVNLSGVATVSEEVRTLIAAIGKLGGKNVQNAIANIPQLEKAIAHLVTTFANLPEVSKNITDFVNSLAGLASQGAKVGTATASIEHSMQGFEKSATRSTKKAKSLASAIGKMYAEFWIAMRAAKGLKNAFMSTADYLEAYNYFDVTATKIGTDTFRKAGEGSAEEYADAFTSTLKEKLRKMSGLELDLESRLIKTTNAKSLGLNLTELTQYQASIASITNAMGVSQEIAQSTAKAFSMLAGDMSSLKNLDFEQVAQNLQSGLSGQARSLYKFGIDITSATLEEYAFAEGIEKSVSEMTQAEKAQLRLLAILDQSKVAWGDLAHTINSPANQLRQLSTNLKEVGTVLGQLFLPSIARALPYINGLSIAIKRLLVDIASMLGIQLDLDEFATGFTDSFEEDTEAVDDLNKSLKDVKKGIREFDELKVISSGKDKGIGGVGDQIDLTQQILDATAEYEKVWDEAYERMESKAQKISEYIGLALEPIKTIIGDFAIGDFYKAGEDVSKLVSSIFHFFADAISEVDWEGLGKKIGDFIRGINWTEILSGIGDLIGSALQGALDLWHGVFNAAPFETAILAGFAVLKFTGLGELLTTNISGAIAKKMTTANITKEITKKLGIGVVTLGIGVALSIDNLVEIKNGKYAGDSVQSLIKVATSSLMESAGIAVIASSLGIASGGVAFGIAAAVTLFVNLFAALGTTSDRDFEREIAEKEHEWVNESHEITVDVLTNINFKEGEINPQFEQIDDLAEKVYNLSLSYDDLTDGQKNLLKYYSEELIQVMPELASQIDTVTGAYKGTREELDKLIESQKKQIKASVIKSSLEEAYTRQYEIKPEYEKLQAEVKVNREGYNSYIAALKDIGLTDETIGRLINGESYEDALYNQTKYNENYYEDYYSLLQAVEKLGKFNVKQMKANLDVSEESLAVMKQDWKDIENVISYYTRELEGNLEGAITTITDANNQIGEAARSSKLPDAISETMDKVASEINDGAKVSKSDMNAMFTSINNSFTGLGDGKVPAEVQDTMNNIEAAILTNSPKLINYMAQLRYQMEQAFANAYYDEAGNMIWNPNNIINQYDNAVAKIESAIGHFAPTKGLGKELKGSVEQIFGGNLPETVQTALNEAVGAIDSNATQKTIQDALHKLENIMVIEADKMGHHIAFGVCGGVTDAYGYVSDTFTEMGKVGEKAYDDYNEFGSPSKLYRRLAKYIPEGVALGIEDGIPEAESAMGDMSKKLKGVFGNYQYNIPDLGVGKANGNSGYDYSRIDSQNAFMSQIAGAVSQAQANGQTEVVFRIEGDPHGMFTVMMEEDSKYKKQTHGRSAFA